MTGDFLETSRPVLAWVLRTTFEASLIAALVLMAQYLLRGRVSARWRYNLWLLVVARLLLPVVPGTQYSPFNLVRLPDAQKPQMVRPAAPRLTPAAPLPATPVPGPAEHRRRNDLYLVSDTHAVAPRQASARPDPVAAEMTGEPSQPVALWTAPSGRSLPDRVRTPWPESPRRQPPARGAVSTTVTPEVLWHQRVNWLGVAGIAWIAGAAFVATRLAWVSLRLSSAVRGLRPVRDSELALLVAECAQRLRLRRLPELLEAPDHFGPALVGLLRPRVVLPGCVLHGSFHRDELRLILMHELAHMKRWDVAANWLLAVLGIFHWFNPFLHLAFRRMRVDRELACDELVLSAAHADAARAYGPTILKLLQTLSRGSQLPGMVGVLEGKQSIRRRIAMIARFDRHRRNDSPLLGIALSLLAGGVALTGAVRGQDAAPREVAVELADDNERSDKAREAQDAAREAADEARDAARETLESAREAADEALQAAQERINEIEQSVNERRKDAQERAAEGERTVAEAQEHIQQRQAETQHAIDEAHQALAEVQQQFEQREEEVRRAVEEAQRALCDHASAEKGEGDESAAEALAERERELKEAVEEREQELASAAEERDQALKEAQEHIERATAEQLSAVQEARSELERAVAEQQNALQEATKAVEEAAAEQGEALQQLANAQEAVAQVGAGLPPSAAQPGEVPVEPQLPEPAAPAAEAPAPVGAAPPAEPGATPLAGLAPAAPAPELPPPGAALGHPARATPSPTPAPRGRGGVAPAAPYGAGGGGYGGYGRQPGYPGRYPGGYGGGYPGGYSGAAAPAGGGMRRGGPQRGAAGGMGGMPGMAPGGMPAEARVEDPAARDADARSAQALRRTLQVNFEGAPLSDVLTFIADNTGVDVVGDWKSLEAAGVDKSAPVTLTLRQGAPAEQVLTWILRSAAGDAAGFAIDHGVVLVSTQDRIDRMVITRAYSLGALAGSGAQLENLVRDTVAPHSWRESGGSGAVRSFNDKLFVTATEPNHRQVERLLGLMNAHGAPAPDGPMPGEIPAGPARRPLGLPAPAR